MLTAGPFRNLYDHSPHRLRDVLRWKLKLSPKEPERVALSLAQSSLPRLEEPAWATIESPDPGKLQITWIGHATFLVQLDGQNWLTDPIFSNYCSPLPMRSCRRLAPPGLPWNRLPKIDGVLLSHAHYDHLDWATLNRLDRRTPIYTPQALGRSFLKKGFVQVQELGWWETSPISPDWRLHACPVQHFSARSPWDWNRTLWCGWLLETPQWKFFFAGDTGYCPVFQEIGHRFPTLDLAILPIGAYAPRWLMKSMHADPFDAVQMHLDLQTRFSVPGHWGTFPLTDEPPGEPAVLLDQARREYHVKESSFPLLQPGQTLAIDRSLANLP